MSVPPVPGKPWTAWDLQRVLLETLDLAKLRAVDAFPVMGFAVVVASALTGLQIGRWRTPGGAIAPGAALGRHRY